MLIVAENNKQIKSQNDVLILPNNEISDKKEE